MDVSAPSPTEVVDSETDLRRCIRTIPDFPIPGILFRDITTLLKDGKAFQEAIDRMVKPFLDRPIDIVAAVEARGYIFAAPIALRLGVGMILVRKPGKLPFETIEQEYALEYGTNTLEVHKDAVAPGMRVLVVDDLIATGGSAQATARLLEKLGARVEAFSFLIELEDLKGRDLLQGYDVHAVVGY